MTFSLDYIRKKVGWCPQGTVNTTRTFPGALKESCQVPARPSPVPPVPSAGIVSPPESRPIYEENILLILVLVGGLFCLIDLKMLAIAAIFSALLVYYDAVTLHAGEKSGEESLFGDVVTWRPTTWAICLFFIDMLFIEIYTFSRKEIFNANT